VHLTFYKLAHPHPSFSSSFPFVGLLGDTQFENVRQTLLPLYIFPERQPPAPCSLLPAKTYEEETTTTSPESRPAAQFVKEAKHFPSEITVTANGKSGNAKSLFKLQTLKLTQGTVVTITAEGEDEKEAVQHLPAFLATLELVEKEMGGRIRVTGWAEDIIGVAGAFFRGVASKVFICGA